tara:strand:+ start:287 stop:772 length:486 start_codon:yes stop_codon:yes gene_type:complete
MSADFAIRAAQSSDAGALTALILRSKASNGYDAEFMAACADELRVTKADILNDAYWVAERGDILGCVCLRTQSMTGEIHAFFIDPDCQRRGVGRALWQVVRTTAVSQGLRRLALNADPAAEPFYARLGFRTVSQMPSGSIPGRRLPDMQMDLRDTDAPHPG